MLDATSITWYVQNGAGSPQRYIFHPYHFTWIHLYLLEHWDCRRFDTSNGISMFVALHFRFDLINMCELASMIGKCSHQIYRCQTAWSEAQLKIKKREAVLFRRWNKSSNTENSCKWLLKKKKQRRNFPMIAFIFDAWQILWEFIKSTLMLQNFLTFSCIDFNKIFAEFVD